MSPSNAPVRWLAKLRAIPRRWLLIGVPVALILLVAYAAAFLVDEPLRRYTEAKMNRALKGYTVRIKTLTFHPLGFSLNLKNLIIVQDTYPDPPVASIPLLSASVHWRALLSGRLVGDIAIDRPTVHVNLKQARREIADPTPIKERGWQQALEAIYPLKIHQFQVNQGDLTYEDEGSFKPLRVRSLNMVATKIRNIRSPDDVYPSPFHLDGTTFESGHVSADGRADFLAEPNVTYRASVVLENIELDYFKPITNRYNVSVDKGVLSAEGAVESARGTTTVELTRAAVSDVRVDYTHTAGTAVAEREQRGRAGAKIREAYNAPAFLFRIQELHISKGTFGFVNKAVTPPYRVFLSDADMALTNLSNQGVEGPAVMKLQGKFMGTGTATADATFRAAKGGPGFDISIRIDEVNMPSMNDLLRAYGKFDVTAGRFFCYSELSVHNGAITGYVKPFFKDMVVYDPRQDKDKSFIKKAYERVVGGVAKVLENRPHQDVATRANISGRFDNPQVSVPDVIVNLVQNAFFTAILPGFDREVGHAPSGGK